MSEAASRIEVPVLVVGAGPAGMMSSILLARLGIESRVVERREGPQRAPAAHVVNARTFEICRAAGVDMEAIAAASKNPADAGQVLWVTKLAGEELGRLPFERQGEDLFGYTPTPLRNLSQHRFEPILLEHLRGEPLANVEYGHEWQSAEQDSQGVTSRILDRAGGRIYEVRSRWLIAADGAGSRIRKSVGIEPVGPARIQSFVMMHFEANLRELVRERPGVLYWITDPDTSGTFVAHDIDSTWVFMYPFDPDRDPLENYTEDVCRDLVCRAMGTESYDFAIRTISSWTMTVQVAERYREGRIFLVGDSAHRFPPTGGLGLNTGVQDAHNLAWKLAAIESGWAGEELLDTYEMERRPVAQENSEQSAANAMRMIEVFQALGASEDRDESRVRYAEVLRDPASRERLHAAIQNQAEHFDLLGLQLGFSYEAGAIVPDGTPRQLPANPVREFLPTGRPGARVPHAWLDRQGTRISTLDLFPLDRFTVIAGPEGKAWLDAAAGIDRVPLQALAIGKDVPDRDGSWARLLGIEPDGALLVRPDQHVAWRSARGTSEPRAALDAALARIVPSR